MKTSATLRDALTIVLVFGCSPSGNGFCLSLSVLPQNTEVLLQLPSVWDNHQESAYDCCARVCKKVRATCVNIRVLSFPKLCPKLSCDSFTFKGNSKEPAHIVGKKSKLVKVIKRKRTIKH